VVKDCSAEWKKKIIHETNRYTLDCDCTNALLSGYDRNTRLRGVREGVTVGDKSSYCVHHQHSIFDNSVSRNIDFDSHASRVQTFRLRHRPGNADKGYA